MVINYQLLIDAVLFDYVKVSDIRSFLLMMYTTMAEYIPTTRKADSHIKMFSTLCAVRLEFYHT